MDTSHDPCYFFKLAKHKVGGKNMMLLVDIFKYFLKHYSTFVEVNADYVKANLNQRYLGFVTVDSSYKFLVYYLENGSENYICDGKVIIYSIEKNTLTD
jgi:hypothetical protein